MNRFSKKVEEKRKLDAHRFDSAVRSIYSSLGITENEYRMDGNQELVAVELSRICTYFGLQAPDFPKQMTSLEMLMQYAMTETGMMQRKIVLTGKWWKDGATPLLSSDKEGIVHALVPAKNGGYIYYKNGEWVKVTDKNADQFEKVCYCFYQPMSTNSMSTKDFIRFLMKAFQWDDVAWLIGISILLMAIGMVMPAIYQFVFHTIIPSGTTKDIFGIWILLSGTVVLQVFCKLARMLWVMRIGNKLELLAQNAIWARVLSLPVNFFKKYSAGELSSRIDAVNVICRILGGEFIPTLLGALFSFGYLCQISMISKELLVPSFLIIILTLMVNIGTTILQLHQNAHNNRVESELYGMVFQLLNGISKIKVAGAEMRAFEKWAKLYQKLKIMPSYWLLLAEALCGAVNFGGVILLYYMAYQTGISASAYIAFHTAFSMLTAAIMSLTGVTAKFATLKPAFDQIKPILEETPENPGYKKQIRSLSGEIELNQVRFRYQEDMPYVLDGLQLHIKKNEYIGIVGSSGSGKSTLMRVLLGFEKPQSGSIYYDMQDAEGLDMKSVRQRIGVVLQNGKLFSGDIYSNIVIGAPWLTVEDAWEAASRSGLDEDIEKMPMGMFTMLSEGGGGLSGSQKQRLLIARALAMNPDIVMFDEATSALDNITQATVVNTLEQMECTRIVIAHRLSTIQNCSRIIYLDKGKVVESGTYEELMQLNGKFAEMAKRQLV